MSGRRRDRIVFNARLGSGVRGGARLIEDLMLPVLGHYNALNALAALAVAAEAGVDDERSAPDLAKLLRGEAALHACRRVAGRAGL
mgnify:CR=1 FL=1